MVTVKQLILGSDPEGNGVYRLSTIDDNAAVTDLNKYELEVGIAKLTPELKKLGFGKSDVKKHQVVFLGP